MTQKAVSYQQMMDMWAWKDFSVFLEEERKSALELAVDSDDIKNVQLNRGKVKQLDAISSHVSSILEGI